MELLEIQNPVQSFPAFDQLPLHTKYLPPVMMFLITSKFFILLIVDIIVITVVTRAGWAASTYHKYVDETVRQYTANMSRTNAGFDDTEKTMENQSNGHAGIRNTRNVFEDHSPISTPMETPNRYNDTSTQEFVYPQRNAYNRGESRQQSEERPTSIQRPTSLAIPLRNNDRPQSRQFVQSPTDENEIDSRLSRYTSSNGSVVRSQEPLKDERISERQQQQGRIKVLPMVAEINRNSTEVKQRPKVPPKPINRTSMQPDYVEERRRDRPENQNAAVNRNSSVTGQGELRGQLPWSYFKARDDVPKKAFYELKEDEELPPVPVPDYTLHFPKARRANVSSDSDDGSWSHQRY